jgi:K+/H+ antiporter YhaU regulatory subunit KhtT
MSRGYQLPLNLGILLLGVFAIYKIATYRKFTSRWENFIEKRLIKSPVFEEEATEDLLHFLEGYGLVKKIVRESSFLVGRTLSKSRLREKGTVVLGIEREKNWIPVPKASEKIAPGDHLVVYGPLDALKRILKEEVES